MSFLFLRGEMIHCTECEKTVSTEYEGGPSETQIGDQAVFEQWALNEKYMPKSYDTYKYGYYYHSIAICKECILINHADEYKMIENDHPVFSYLDYVSSEKSKISDLISSKAKYYVLNINKEHLMEMNPARFKELGFIDGMNVLALKKESCKRFFEEEKAKFIEGYKTFITETDQYKSIKRAVEYFEENNEADVIKLLDHKGKYFVKIDYKATVNLNPYICYEMTVRKGKEASSNMEFYSGPVPIKRYHIGRALSDGTKFTLDSIEMRIAIEKRVEKNKENIINKMMEMDFLEDKK